METFIFQLPTMKCGLLKGRELERINKQRRQSKIEREKQSEGAFAKVLLGRR